MTQQKIEAQQFNDHVILCFKVARDHPQDPNAQALLQTVSAIEKYRRELIGFPQSPEIHPNKN